MAMRFYYQNIEMTENTDAYLRAQIQGSVEKVFSDGRYSVFVRTKSIPAKGKKSSHYMCELRLDLPNVAPIFLKKEGKSFHETVKSLGEALINSVGGNTALA